MDIRRIVQDNLGLSRYKSAYFDDDDDDDDDDLREQSVEMYRLPWVCFFINTLYQFNRFT